MCIAVLTRSVTREVRRIYHYCIVEGLASVFASPYAWHLGGAWSPGTRLDIEAMHLVVQTLVRTAPRDSSAFFRARSDATHTQITVHVVSVRHAYRFVFVDVSAYWIVYGMMRLLVASLVDVGRHHLLVNALLQLCLTQRCQRFSQQHLLQVFVSFPLVMGFRLRLIRL